MQSFIDELLAADPASSREANRARLRVAVAEALMLRMEELGKNKANLADALGVSRSAVTQALTGNRNMSLNLLADMAAALNLRPKVLLEVEHLASGKASNRTEVAAEYHLLTTSNVHAAVYNLHMSSVASKVIRLTTAGSALPAVGALSSPTAATH